MTVCSGRPGSAVERSVDRSATGEHAGRSSWLLAALPLLAARVGPEGSAQGRAQYAYPWYLCHCLRETRRKTIPFSTEALHRSLKVHVGYYNRYRTHQATAGHRPPDPCHDIFSVGDGAVKRCGMLGNSLNWYVREAG